MKRLCVPVMVGALAIAGCGDAPGTAVVPDVAQAPPSSPDCAYGADDTVTPVRRGAVPRPAQPVPYYAARAGRLPADGEPVVAGVALPSGSRCRRVWTTDEPMADPLPVATRLAAHFERTGLWPVLWSAQDGDPDPYLSGEGNPARVARIDPARELRRVWADYGSEDPFPALAPGTGGVGTGPATADPFGTYVRALPAEHWPAQGWYLLLVPVQRPADIVSVVGPFMTETLGSDDVLSAVARSGEERFGTVPVALGASTLDLLVDAPPVNPDQALRLAYEQHAFAPESDVMDGPEDLPALAERLRSGEPAAGVFRSRLLWQFGWPD